MNAHGHKRPSVDDMADLDRRAAFVIIIEATFVIAAGNDGGVVICVKAAYVLRRARILFTRINDAHAPLLIRFAVVVVAYKHDVTA